MKNETKFEGRYDNPKYRDGYDAGATDAPTRRGMLVRPEQDVASYSWAHGYKRGYAAHSS